MSIASRVLSLHEAAQLHRPERALLTLSLLVALLLHAVLAGAWPSLTRLAESARAVQEPTPPREPEQMQYIILPDTIEKDEEVNPDAAIAQARNSQQARQKDDSPELPEGGPTSEGISKVSTQTVDSTPAVPLTPAPTPPTPPSREPSPAATPMQPTPPTPAVPAAQPAQPTPQAQPLSALPPQTPTPPEVTEQTPVPEALAPLGDEPVAQIPRQNMKEPPVAPKEQPKPEPKPETKPERPQEQRPEQTRPDNKQTQQQQPQQQRQPTPPQPQATPAPRTPPPVKKIGPQETPREKQTAVTRKTRARVGGDNSLMLLKSRYGAYMDKVIKRLEEAVRRAESMGIMATQRGIIRTSFRIGPTGDLIEAKILEAPAEMLREQNIVRMIYEDARAQGLFDPPSESMQKDPDFNPIIVSYWFE